MFVLTPLNITTKLGHLALDAFEHSYSNDACVHDVRQTAIPLPPQLRCFLPPPAALLHPRKCFRDVCVTHDCACT